MEITAALMLVILAGDTVSQAGSAPIATFQAPGRFQLSVWPDCTAAIKIGPRTGLRVPFLGAPGVPPPHTHTHERQGVDPHRLAVHRDVVLRRCHRCTSPVYPFPAHCRTRGLCWLGHALALVLAVSIPRPDAHVDLKELYNKVADGRAKNFEACVAAGRVPSRSSTLRITAANGYGSVDITVATVGPGLAATVEALDAWDGAQSPATSPRARWDRLPHAPRPPQLPYADFPGLAQTLQYYGGGGIFSGYSRHSRVLWMQDSGAKD